MLYTFEGWFCSAKLLDFPFFAIALFCTVQFWKHRVFICVLLFIQIRGSTITGQLPLYKASGSAVAITLYSLSE